jgi:hypothetical protein
MGVTKVICNGIEVQDGYISLEDDGIEHTIQVIMGKAKEIEETGKNFIKSEVTAKNKSVIDLPVSAAKAQT